MSNLNAKLTIVAAVVVSVSLGYFSGYYMGRKSYTDPIKSEYGLVYATFNGGEVKGKDVLDRIHEAVASLPKRIYEEKRIATLDLARMQILANEAAKRKIKPDDIVADIVKHHENDVVTPAAFSQFLLNHGMVEGKMPKIERENFMKQYKRQTLMEIQSNAINDILKAANIQLHIPELKQEEAELKK